MVLTERSFATSAFQAARNERTAGFVAVFEEVSESFSDLNSCAIFGVRLLMYSCDIISFTQCCEASACLLYFKIVRGDFLIAICAFHAYFLDISSCNAWPCLNLEWSYRRNLEVRASIGVRAAGLKQRAGSKRAVDAVGVCEEAGPALADVLGERG